MEVHRIRARAWMAILLSVSLITGCGTSEKFNVDTERGRQARIDEANYRLSISDCNAAQDAIDPLYNDIDLVNEEIRIIKASTFACKAGFQTLRLLSNFASASDPFGAAALTMNGATNETFSNLISAADVLDEFGGKSNAGSRGTETNTFMVFLQFAIVGAILAREGSPSTSGAQGEDLSYTAVTVAGDISSLNACTLAAAFPIMIDSFNHTNLGGDADTSSAINTVESACVTAGLTSCTQLSNDRTACTGEGSAADINAAAIVAGINLAWQ